MEITRLYMKAVLKGILSDAKSTDCESSGDESDKEDLANSKSDTQISSDGFFKE